MSLCLSSIIIINSDSTQIMSLTIIFSYDNNMSFKHTVIHICQYAIKILPACWYLWCWWSLSSCGVLGVIMRLKTKTVTWGHIHHRHTDRAVKTPQQDPPVFLSSTGGAQCKHNCNYHKMERFLGAELGSTKPAILVKSLGKYFLVQVKEFPAGQVNDKLYEAGGEEIMF